MRNLKRALSLALASVMLLGMMVVGTSAASYPDVDENDNVEAIEVLNAVNVMIGRQGNFEPDEAVNRHEMAVIMAKLVLGVDTADNYVGSHPFTDVVPWADKYVAACYENGLVAGTSATTYGGGNPLTAVQAAAMMLRALGYKDLSVGAQDWRAPVTAMANQIRLFSGVASNPNEKLNRNQVAQLALNTLKSPMVNLKDNTISWTNGDGQLIMTGGSREYIALSSHEAYAQAINNTERAGTSASGIQGYTVELGEHLYNGKLKLNNKDIDVFGRPSRTWEYDGKKIGSYIKDELMVMDNVGKVTGVDLYNLLGSSTIKDYTLDVYVDGVNDPAVYDAITNARKDGSNTSVVFDKTDLNRNNKAGVGGTGTGVLTQVFVDHEEDKIYVAVINTYLAIADKAYDEKKEEASIEVFDLTKDLTKAVYAKTVQNPMNPAKTAYIKQSVKFTLGNEDFDLVKDIAKDDPYLVTVADGAVQTIEPAEVLEGVTISAFKKFDHVVTGGTTYNYTTTAGYKNEDLSIYTSNDVSNLKELTYNIYLDAYGNLIGLKENDAVKNYVFLTSIDRNGKFTTNTTATANAVFLDGTSASIEINMAKSVWRDNRWDGTSKTSDFGTGDAMLNTWATYSKNGDVYTIREVWNVATPDGTPGGTVVRGDNRFPKAVASGDAANSTNLAQYHDTSLSEITLKNGLRLPGGYAVNQTFYSAYGDSNSVYLTADLGTLHNGGKFGVIKGAETVHTGIDGTSITVWTGDDARKEANKDRNNIDLKLTTDVPIGAGDPVSEGVYTLYNDKGIVIASMVVGEGSSARDLVYVHSSGLDLEEDNGGSNGKAANDGLWTWYRKVIRNGEEVTLTEVGDAAEELISMKQYQWYQVKTDGNGNVTKAEPAFEALDVYAPGNNDRAVLVTDYKQINEAVANNATDTVLYQTDGGPYDYVGSTDGTHVGFDATQDLEIQGNNILAVTNKQGAGIYFRDDVHVVLQYWNRNVDGIDILVGEGVDDLKDMVDYVNANNDAAAARNASRNRLSTETYYVSALIQNGAATTIVIYDNFNGYARPAADAKDRTLTLKGTLGLQLFDTEPSSVYLVDTATGKMTLVDFNEADNIGWFGGSKSYTIKAGSTVRIYDDDVTGGFIPVFDPELETPYTVRTDKNYIQFVMPDNNMSVREKKVGDERTIERVAFTLSKPLGSKLTPADVKGVGYYDTLARATGTVNLVINDVTVTYTGGKLQAVIDWDLPASSVYELDTSIAVALTDAEGERVTSTIADTTSSTNVTVNSTQVASVPVVEATVSSGSVTIASLDPEALGASKFEVWVDEATEPIAEGTVTVEGGEYKSTIEFTEEGKPTGTFTVNGDTVEVSESGSAVVGTLPNAASIDKTELTVAVDATGTAKVTLADAAATATVASDDEEIATVDLAETTGGFTVTVTGEAAGTTDVTVTVTASGAGTHRDVTLTIAVTVEAAAAAKADAASISPATLTVDAEGTGEATITLADATAEVGTPTSSDSTKATATYKSATKKVTVTGVAEGSATISIPVTAVDTENYKNVTLEITVTVNAAEETGATAATYVVDNPTQASTTPGTNDLVTVTIGGKAYDVAYDSENNTVADQIAAWVDAFNADTENPADWTATAGADADNGKVVITYEGSDAVDSEPAGFPVTGTFDATGDAPTITTDALEQASTTLKSSKVKVTIGGKALEVDATKTELADQIAAWIAAFNTANSATATAAAGTDTNAGKVVFTAATEGASVTVKVFTDLGLSGGAFTAGTDAA